MSEPAPLALDADVIELVIYGAPVAQGSKKAFVHRVTGKAVVTEQLGQRHKSWREAVRSEAQRWIETHGGQVIDEAVTVTVTFFLPRPKKPKWKAAPAGPPDLDKLIRAVSDAITKVLIADDARITRLVAEKAWADEGKPPGAVIRIEKAGA